MKNHWKYSVQFLRHPLYRQLVLCIRDFLPSKLEYKSDCSRAELLEPRKTVLRTRMKAQKPPTLEAVRAYRVCKLLPNTGMKFGSVAIDVFRVLGGCRC